MIANSQGALYFSRMSRSLGDKQRLLPFVKTGRILDVGAGGGELSASLAALPGNSVVALDGSPVAAERLRSLPGIEVAECFAQDALTVFGENSFDTIICSSILHEVYSYGVGDGVCDLPGLHRVLADFRKLLKPAGRLLIRDGVLPENWEMPVRMEFSDNFPQVCEDLRAYEQLAPFWGHGLRKVFLKVSGKDVLSGNLESAMEFLYTWTWGRNSLSREAHELYGIFTPKDYASLLSELGFQVSHSEAYIQPGYVEHLKTVRILSETGVALAFPLSNQIVVAERK